MDRPVRSYIVKGLKALAGFDSQHDASVAFSKLNDPTAKLVHNTADVEKWDIAEPELRLMCAALRVPGYIDMPEDKLRAEAKKLRDTDELVSKRIKNRRSLSNYYVMRLDEFAPATVRAAAVPAEPTSNDDDKENDMSKANGNGAAKKATKKSAKKATTPATPKEKKPSAKDHLRQLFSRKGSSASIADMTLKGKIPLSTMKTAVSDLKNKKYAGGDVIVIERQEDESYKRVS